jgi:hypothetical protein
VAVRAAPRCVQHADATEGSAGGGQLSATYQIER